MSAPRFEYQAFDAAGALRRGRLDAESERDAVRILRGRRLTPVKVAPARPAGAGRPGRRVRPRDVLEFTKALRTLVEARVPIDKALRLLDSLTESPAMRALAAGLLRDVKEGRGLADAMARHPEAFSRMYVSIVRAGEEGGILDQLLPGLAEFLEASARARQGVVAAMIYPAVLLATGLVSVLLLLVFVVPQFAAMFEDAGVQAPPAAAFLMELSGLLARRGWLLPAAAFALALGWRRLGASPRARAARDAFLLSLPLLGRLILHRECAVFARTLGALLGAGIPLIRALRVAREVVGSAALADCLVRVEEDVRGGAGLGPSLEKTGRFPVLLHRLVAVGEESGRTSAILLKAADAFDEQARHRAAALVSALQPALIIFLAVVVGGITITMLSAVFGMNAVEF